jgi:hypothetical protein
MKVPPLDEPDVGRNTVACSQSHDVAWNDVPSRDISPGAISADSRGWDESFAKSICRLLRPVRLEKVQDEAQDDHEHNDGGIDPVPKESRKQAGQEQDSHQWVGKEPYDGTDAVPLPRYGRFIRPDFLEPPVRLVA